MALTLCLMGNFHAFLLSADFFIIYFLKNSFRNTIRESNCLHPDQARHIAGPDLGANCLQRLSADSTGRQSFEFLKSWILETFSFHLW